jgi:hypothetical protein
MVEFASARNERQRRRSPLSPHLCSAHRDPRLGILQESSRWRPTCGRTGAAKEGAGGLDPPLLASFPACRGESPTRAFPWVTWLRVLSARFEVRSDVQPASRTEVPGVPITSQMPLDFHRHIFHCVVRPVLNEVDVDRQERMRATVTPCRARVGRSDRRAQVDRLTVRSIRRARDPDSCRFPIAFGSTNH